VSVVPVIKVLDEKRKFGKRNAEEEERQLNSHGMGMYH
jgi:hypothetical protein